MNYLTAFLDDVSRPSKITDTYSEEPTKPPKPGFGGFGSELAHTFPEIEAVPISGDTYLKLPPKPPKPTVWGEEFPAFDSLPGPDDLERARTANQPWRKRESAS